MITKWICIPYGIVIVTIAGFAKNVIPDYLASYSMWYSSYDDYSMLEYALVLGIYGGIITGLVVDTLSHRTCLLIAAVLSIVSYGLIPQFDGSTRTKLEDWHYYVGVSLVLLVGQSVSLACITTVKLGLMNFSITASPMILSLLLSYWYICIHIESSVRWSFFAGVDTKVYMMGVGITTSIIYSIGAIIMGKEKTQHQGGVSQYHLAMLDKIGLGLFVVFEIFMILLLMFFKLIIRDTVVSTWVGVVLLLGNFILPIINAEGVLSKASEQLRGFTPDIDELHKLQRGRDKNIFGSLKSIKLLALLIATGIMVGSGGEIFKRLPKIGISISMGYLAEYAMIWFIFGNFVTRGLIGMMNVIINIENDFAYIIFFAFEILISTVMIILIPAKENVILFNAAGFLGGSGVGGFYIMIPLILIQDYGPKHFGILWGTFTLAMEFGSWFFTLRESFMTDFIPISLFALFGLLLIGGIWFMDNRDSEEGSKERTKQEEVKDGNDFEAHVPRENIQIK